MHPLPGLLVAYGRYSATRGGQADVIYVGTGEACIRGNISHGDGVYKTLDGGKTWKNVGLHDSRAIGRVIINPTNPDIAFVAALGHPYGPNTERGIFRTVDGGKSWEKVLYKDENTGGIDVAFDPRNPDVVLVAALGEAYGPNSERGVFRTTDGGATWQKVLYKDENIGAVDLAADPDNPQTIIKQLLLCNDRGGLEAGVL